MKKHFYKATDIEGKVFVLVEVAKTHEGDKVREASFNSADGRLTFRYISHFNVTNYTAPVTEIEASEFSDVLSSWGYAADADRESLTPTDTNAGAPTENGSNEGVFTSTPAVASGEAQSPSDAATTESISAEVASQNQAAAESGNELSGSPVTEGSEPLTVSESASSDSVEETVATEEGMPEKVERQSEQA